MGVIMHNNISYGGGSSIEPNPQESATEQLETLGIDGDVYEVTDANAIHTSDVGVANGVAELDANGFVPSSQLPSYVDDVLEYASRSAFPATGETGKIYVALDTNLTYRWGGSDYVEISPSLALGETSSTAYRGDRGKIAYDHSQSDHSGIKPAFTEASTRANIASGETIATIFGKIKKFFSDLKTVAFTGAYSDLSGTPTIPTVNDATLTIQKNGTAVETFTANSSTNKTANITVPTKTSDLTNDSGFVTTDEKVTGQTQNPSSSTVYNVPFIGATNQKPYVNDGLTYATKEGTANSAGWSCLVLGNAVASTSAGSKHGELWLQGDTTNYVKLGVDLGITGNRTINLPDKNGTVALTSDLSGYLPLSGGTLTGQLTFAQAGYKTYNVSGYAVDDAGNFAHTNSNAAHWFHLDNQAKNMSLKYYWETGKLYVPADIYANGDKQVITSATIGSQSVDKATKDGDGNTISSTYLKNSNVLMKNGDANVSPAGYRNIGGTNDYITLSEAGTYLITAWAMFKGGTGNKAVLICRASDNAAYGQSWESSTINQSYPKTFTCFHVATVTSTTLYFRARVYTENTDVYGGISGGIYAIKVS